MPQIKQSKAPHRFDLKPIKTKHVWIEKQKTNTYTNTLPSQHVTIIPTQLITSANTENTSPATLPTMPPPHTIHTPHPSEDNTIKENVIITTTELFNSSTDAALLPTIPKFYNSPTSENTSSIFNNFTTSKKNNSSLDNAKIPLPLQIPRKTTRRKRKKAPQLSPLLTEAILENHTESAPMDTTISNNLFSFLPYLFTDDDSSRSNRSGLIHSDHASQQSNLSDGLSTPTTPTASYEPILGHILSNSSFSSNTKPNGMGTDVLAANYVHASMIPIAMDTSEQTESTGQFLHNNH